MTGATIYEYERTDSANVARGDTVDVCRTDGALDEALLIVSDVGHTSWSTPKKDRNNDADQHVSAQARPSCSLAGVWGGEHEFDDGPPDHGVEYETATGVVSHRAVVALDNGIDLHPSQGRLWDENREFRHHDAAF